MKKSLCAVLLLLTALTGFAQIIDKPVATVNLTKREVITQKQLKQEIDTLEKGAKTTVAKEQRKDVLDVLINGILVIQAADRDGIKVTDFEINNYITQQIRTPLETSLGKKLSDADFKKYIQDQSGMPWDDFYKQVKDNALKQRYVTEKKKDQISKIPDVTDKEIQDAYNQVADQLINPELVKVSQLYIDTRQMNGADKDKAKKEADAINSDLKNGKVSFNDIIAKYTENPKPNYQVSTFYLARNDQQQIALLGSSYYDTVFSMNPGEVKGVVESKVGLCILRLVEKIPRKFLTLDDPIRPDQKATVRDYLRQQILLQKQQSQLQAATADLVADLRKKADIKVNQENLNW